MQGNEWFVISRYSL